MAEEKYTEKVIGKTMGNVPVVATKELKEIIEGGGGGVTQEAILNLVKGSDYVSVDAGEEGTELEGKVVIKEDEEVAPHLVELEFTAPSTTEGDISEEDFVKLAYSRKAEILLDDEYYRLADKQETFDVYSHVGRDATNKVYIKTLYIYTSEESELYRHFILSVKEISDPAGSFVKVISAPESTTLTDDQISLFTSGVFVNGEFLQKKNPVFFPAILVGERYKGLCISKNPGNEYSYISIYRINENKVISIEPGTTKSIQLDNIYSINGVTLGSVLGILSLSRPADAETKTYVPKLVNGVWTMVEETE